jgi:hypothetical protein
MAEEERVKGGSSERMRLSSGKDGEMGRESERGMAREKDNQDAARVKENKKKL